MNAALEWIDYQALICPGCGHLKTDTMDPGQARTFEATPLTCYGCAARDAEKRNVSRAIAADEYADSAFDGVYIAVARQDR